MVFPKQKPCTLYLARHGETDWNATGIVLGQNPRPVLTKTGNRQARQIAIKLKRVVLAAVFTSDLPRTIQTAKLIIGRRRLKISTLSALRERHYGKFDGQPAEAYEAAVAKKIKQRQRLSGLARMKFKLGPNIETDYQVYHRFTAALKKLSRQHPGKNVLVVTHGGCLRNFLVGNNLATHQQLPKDKLMFGDYLKVGFDGARFCLIKKVN